MNMKRAKFIEHSATHVSLTYFCDLWDEEVTRDFFVRSIEGGYVRDGNGNQVCDYFYSRGPTLDSSGHDLLEFIRREYRRFKRREHRDE
jgi:hypothetical protein